MGDSNASEATIPVGAMLAPPPITALREEAKEAAHNINMERQTSADFRGEREDLKKAAEQSLNAILELDLQGQVRWISPSWEDLTGMPAKELIGKPISDVVLDNPAVFTECMEWMRKDDSKSKIIRFSVKSPTPPEHEGNSSADDRTPVDPKARPEWPSTDEQLKQDPDEEPAAEKEREEEAQDVIDLEAQGIMVYDRATGNESHTMWMVKPAMSLEITIDLPEVIVTSLGVGAEMLAHYLTQLAEVGGQDPEHHPPPMPVLCRICERQITPWWFEKHTELCSQEHRAELEVQMCQESLNEQRSALVKVLDALEVQTRGARPIPNDTGSPAPPAKAEYKGLAIGPSSNPSSGSTSGRASPANQTSRSRESSASGLSHHRVRSFAVRRPLARIVELVLDLCDTAMEISTPAIKDNSRQPDGDFRTQSPQSEGRIQQVLQWQSPSQSSLENEQGLALLCDDTSSLAKAKVDAVFRHRRILEYAERIRVEYDILVQECIEAALEKARRIAAGEDSESSSDDSTQSAHSARRSTLLEPHPEEEMEQLPGPAQPVPTHLPADEDFIVGSLSRSPGPSAMAMALRNASELSLPRRDSTGDNSGASSPQGATTPKSSYGASLENSYHFSKRGSIAFESDTGADSDSGSVRSSVTNQSHSRQRNESPSAETSLKRVASSRERKRTSLVLPSLAAQQIRHQSPARGPPAPSSPLRMAKPRLTSSVTMDAMPSPLTSPVISHSDFASPVLRAQHPTSHHRRQSSAALLDALGRPSSPRLSAANPQPRAVQTSIKDFEIIKPISKGAFGSVYLSKKKSTGDYYAIKVLNRSDMVAKNQVTNVKAERAIMMWQGESDFVAKLYWTFSSKDYLYLVMEYLNGGDCASLIKVLGALPEDWTKKYIAEVVLCVQHLHDRQIVHRDLKPDNLLIDAKGHLKLTDFGLSRMGLIGRQKRALNAKPDEQQPPDLLKQGPFKRAPSVSSSRSTSMDIHGVPQSPAQTPALAAAVSDLGPPSYFSLNRETSRDTSRRTSGHRSDSNESDALSNMFRRFSVMDGRTPIEEETGSEEGDDSPEPYSLHPVKSNTSQGGQSGTPPHTAMPPPVMALFDPEDSDRRFVGTPDYLAPETINGLGQDEMSDWWSLGCILFECLYGRPPFNADTPEEVFKNILARRIQWPEEDEEDPASEEAKDLMNRLMCIDPKERLGSNKDEKYDNGGEEIKAHPWFSDINWETLREDEASFIPQSENPEDTEYFDSRGATMQNFAAEFQDQESSPAHTPGADYMDRPHDALSKVRNQVNSIKRGLMPLHIPAHVRDSRSRRLSEPMVADDFGNFNFKNLPVLEKANKDVIQKLRHDAMQAQAKSSAQVSQVSSPAVTSAAASPSPPSAIASLEASPVIPMPLKRTLSTTRGGARPHSPSLLSQSNSSPNRGSQPSSPLLISFNASNHERRKTSSGSSSLLSQQTSNSLQPGSFFDQAPRLPVHVRTPSAAPSPVKSAKSGSIPQLPIPEPKGFIPSRRTSVSSPRQRSHTVGSQDGKGTPEGDLVPDLLPSHYKRRSQVFDVSPSSSDNEEQRQQAILRVQRRRHSSRRLSQITLADGPTFRTLDVLVCEDHPVSRLIMERLLDKLRCRTICVHDGSEAMRVAMSEIKFDIIMMEYKLPQINGADVARMIRDTHNPNKHTPIVAVTGYLKELHAPHHFDGLIEKPATREKLEEVIGRLCQWKAPPEGWKPPPPGATMVPSGLRQEASVAENSPTTTTSSGFSGYPQVLSSSYRGSSREDSIGSSSLGDTESHYDSIPVIISRQATDEFHDADLERNFGGLGISSPTEGGQDVKRELSPRAYVTEEGQSASTTDGLHHPIPRRMPSSEAIEAKRRSLEKGRHESAAESGDDEDDELGNITVRQKSPKRSTIHKRQSKLGTEMMRANSQGSIISAEDMATAQSISKENMANQLNDETIPEQPVTAMQVPTGHLTPPEYFPKMPGDHTETINMDAPASGSDPEATPRPQTTVRGIDPGPALSPRSRE